ncbi:hypothetical protein NXX23_03015 [Bacteroides ovatus]|nr:hypothetical protein [Bacteroides ovatus]
MNATEDSGYPATYYAVVDYAHKVPSPANSTGWFLPSISTDVECLSKPRFFV